MYDTSETCRDLELMIPSVSPISTRESLVLKYLVNENVPKVKIYGAICNETPGPKEGTAINPFTETPQDTRIISASVGTCE